MGRDDPVDVLVKNRTRGLYAFVLVDWVKAENRALDDWLLLHHEGKKLYKIWRLYVNFILLAYSIIQYTIIAITKLRQALRPATISNKEKLFHEFLAFSATVRFILV